MRDTTNPELKAAWATVPEVAEAQERYEAARKLRQDFPRGATPAEALAGVQRDAQAEFVTSGKWPTDYAKRVAKAHAEAVAWDAEAVALRSLESATKSHAEDLRDTLSYEVLTHLDGRLTEILGAATDAGDVLGNVTTPEQAIEAGGEVLDAWRRLTSLVRDYRNVREASWDVLRSVSGSDDRSRMAQWRRAGHGEIRGVRLDDVPAHIVDVMRSGAYTVEYLVWLARSGAAFVAESYSDMEASVMSATEPLAYDDQGPVRDLSPRVTPIRQPRPAQTYAHSSTPHLDFTQPSPERPKANAAHPDREPTTYDYFQR